MRNEKANKLFEMIINGLSDLSFEQTKLVLEDMQPLDIINNVLVGALDAVGEKFEKGIMFLPQLMKSAETVKKSFDAIKEYIVPTLTENQIKFVYAEEADVLNVALFGVTAKEWRKANPDLAKKGNIRDYTDLLHLVILNNLQNTNAELIENNVSQSERLIRLNNFARRQIKSLQNNKNLHELEKLQEQVNNEKYLLE